VPVKLPNINKYYAYTLGLTSVREPFAKDSTLVPKPIKTWKKGERYIVGLQFQYKNGFWSEVVFNKHHDVKDDYNVDGNGETNTIEYVHFRLELDEISIKSLIEAGYRKVRPVYVPLRDNDRIIPAQGFITNTLRPSGDVTVDNNIVDFRLRALINSGGTPTATDFMKIYRVGNILEEVENSVLAFNTDWSNVSLYSPDVQYNENISFDGVTHVDFSHVAILGGRNVDLSIVGDESVSRQGHDERISTTPMDSNNPYFNNIDFINYPLVEPTIFTWGSDTKINDKDYKFKKISSFKSFNRTFRIESERNTYFKINSIKNLLITDPMTNFIGIPPASCNVEVRLYRRKVEEVRASGGDNVISVSMTYASNAHAILALPNLGSSSNVNNINSSNLFDISGILNRHILRPRDTYVYIVDLVRPSYRKDTLPNNIDLKWIPCGESMRLDEISLSKPIIADWGDTFIQKYEFVRTYAEDVQQPQQFTEVVSIWLSSYINLDGRYDSRQYSTIAHNWDNNSIRINPSYSQRPNFWDYNVFDDKLDVMKFPHVFTWSLGKSYGEFIDNYTKINLMRNYVIDGELGSINKLTNFKNELFGFQDKGIFNILYNQRAALSTSVGQDILLGSTNQVQGVRYITKNNGCLNKWSVLHNSDGLFFIDDITKDLMAFGDPPMSLSNAMGFKIWASKYLKSQSIYHLGNKEQFILNQDIAGDAIYANSKNQSLLFNTRLKQFESFTPHKDIPFMFNVFGEFVSIKNTERYENDNPNDPVTEIWINNTGEYGDFYGEVENSYITYFINPEPTVDKTFDVLQYRMDVFDEETVVNEDDTVEIRDRYLPNDTFHSLTVKNEFQDRNIILNHRDRRKPNVRKKMRIWNMPIPRSIGTLQRMRNPWLELMLEFKGGDNRRFKLHDTIIAYTT
jgi:hypothetical protein